MKKLNETDLESARIKLTNRCDEFIKENKDYWANYSLIGKSANQIVKDLIKELNSQESVAQLISKVGEYKQNGSLAKKLHRLVVVELCQVSDKEIHQLGLDIANQNLVAASRGFSLGLIAPAPDIDAAIEKLFSDYCKAAKSAIPLPSLELA